MSVFGTGRLQIVKGNMNEDQYKTILEKRLLSQLNEWPCRRSFSDTEELIIHARWCSMSYRPKGRSVTQFIAEHGIETLPWPLGILKPEMKKKTIANKHNLIEKLIYVWARNDKIPTQ